MQRPNAPAGASAGGIPGERLDVAEAEPRQVGQLQAAEPRDVAEGVAAGRVAISGGVRHGADTYAIEDDPDDSAEHKFER